MPTIAQSADTALCEESVLRLGLVNTAVPSLGRSFRACARGSGEAFRCIRACWRPSGLAGGQFFDRRCTGGTRREIVLDRLRRFS